MLLMLQSCINTKIILMYEITALPNRHYYQIVNMDDHNLTIPRAINSIFTTLVQINPEFAE